MPTKRKRKAALVVVAVKHDTGGNLGARAVTYQREMILCGKAGCAKLHGPYWYAYWRSAQRPLGGGESKLCKRYIGKDWRRLTPPEARMQEAPKKRKAKQ